MAQADRGPARAPHPLRLRAGRLDGRPRARPRRRTVRRRRRQPGVPRDGPSTTATSWSSATRRATRSSARPGIERARGLDHDDRLGREQRLRDAVRAGRSTRACSSSRGRTRRAPRRSSLQAGADRIVSPYTRAGRQIAELAVRPRRCRLHRLRAVARRARLLDRGGRGRRRRPARGPDGGRPARSTGSSSLAVVRGDARLRAEPGRRAGPRRRREPHRVRLGATTSCASCATRA